MMKPGRFNLEFEALRASGIAEKESVRYSQLFDEMQDRLLRCLDLSEAPVQKAKLIFDYLWREKPNRYKPNGNYKLSDTIQCQLAREGREVGNCLGLTVLYNCLLHRMDVPVKTLYLESAFGQGPHVLSVMSKTGICIEHMFRTGFDFKGHTDDSEKIIWDDYELVADIYNSRGTECFNAGAFKQALASYEKAACLNPKYEKARINKAIVLDKLAMNGGTVLMR
jgi:tetratricopeptide (TPR) repeat protein